MPFATAYLGEHRFDQPATSLYMAVLVLPAIGYSWLQWIVRHTGAQHPEATLYHRRTMRKGLLTIAVYTLGFAISFVAPPLNIACAALVAIFWLLPQSRIDRLFARG